MDNITYQTREQWINAFITAARPVFAEAGYPIPMNVRAGVGFPSTGWRSKTIGECIFPEASSDNHFEIFLNPTVKGDKHLPDARLADVLTHELIHAAANTKGHRKAFETPARLLGLDGQLTATYGGSGWLNWAGPILQELGPMPYGNIVPSAARKTVKTWGIKLDCPDCGWLARVSAKHINAHAYLTCPTPDCGGIMTAHMDDETETD
jgi:hypothetical protein